MALERKTGGKLHPKLNIGLRPIANKYHEGIVKRTLERKLEVPEIAEIKANGMSEVKQDCGAQLSVSWCVCLSILGCFRVQCVLLCMSKPSCGANVMSMR